MGLEILELPRLTKLSFSSTLVPHLIGKQGWRIKVIQEETNTRIYVLQDRVDNAGNVTCEIFGNSGSRTQAVKKIQDFISGITLKLTNQPKPVKSQQQRLGKNERKRAVTKYKTAYKQAQAKISREVMEVKIPRAYESRRFPSAKKGQKAGFCDPERLSICSTPFCEAVFSSRKKYERHATIEHPIVYTREVKKSDMKSTPTPHEVELVCQNCLRSFGNHKSLLIHLRQRYEDRHCAQFRLIGTLQTSTDFQKRCHALDDILERNQSQKRKRAWNKSLLVSFHQTRNLRLTLFNNAIIIGPVPSMFAFEGNFLFTAQNT